MRVAFTDDADNEETLTSHAVLAIAAGVEAPDAPRKLRVSATESRELDLYWEAPASDGGSAITGYRVQWKEAADSWDTEADVFEETVTGTTYTITGLTGGVEYAVRVIATNGAGDGPSSAEATGTPAGGTSQQNTEPENAEPTGLPTISGTVQVGETLTAHTSDIDDQDGRDNAVFSYQWVREEVGADSDIAEATASTYTLVAADQGKTVKVWVSFTDDAGNEESLTSDATETVAARPNSPATGQPTIGGTAQVGQTFTADTSDVDDADGKESSEFSYQWLADDVEIQGATDSTYTLVAADEGRTVKVRVSFTDDAGNEESLTSDATAAVAARPNTPVTGQPTIGGTVQVGETLTADTSDIDDADGRDNAVFSYQWLTDDAEIDGATSSTYTLAAADEGRTIKVRVSFTDDRGNDETLTSDATEAVMPAPNSEEETGDEEPIWSSTLTAGDLGSGYGYDSAFYDPPAGSLSSASFEIDGVAYTVNMIAAADWMYIGLDRELPTSFKLEVDGAELDSGDASFASYSYAEVYRWEDAGLVWEEEDIIELRLFLGDGDSG